MSTREHLLCLLAATAAVVVAILGTVTGVTKAGTAGFGIGGRCSTPPGGVR